MADDSRTAPNGEPHSPDDRLESWKDIAAYLRRDVRTVQRWEQHDGLPVHRHQRAHRPIPYAYKSELDAWWTGRSDASGPAALDTAAADPRLSRGRQVFFTIAALLVVAVAAAFWLARARAPRAETAAVAVLPFLDLSEGMKNEEFADWMTEELIDRLSKVEGLRVPAPAATFVFKNKHVAVPEIAKTLHVTHVLDGSVRKSGARVRVAARLLRGDTGDIVWSDTYERAWDDILVVQDDIAGRVISALRTSFAAAHGHS